MRPFQKLFIEMYHQKMDVLDLAHKAGVDQKTCFNHLTGKRDIEPEYLLKYCSVLDIDPSWFYKYFNQIEPNKE